MKPFRNLDIYLEILRHLDFSIEDNDTDFILSNRHTMYSLALTSTRFSNLALDALWKTMETLEPIVYVLNASSPTFSTIWEDDHWKLAHCSKDTISRAQIYLSRVRNLYFDSFPSDKECLLWQMLLAAGKAPFICPNLRSLWLDVGGPRGGGLDLVYQFTPILSSSLEALSVSADRHSGEEIAFTLLDILHHRDAPLRHFSYDGCLSRRIDQYFSWFLDLRMLSICPSEIDCESPNLSEVETLGNLKQLTELRIDLGCFWPDVRVGDTLSTLGALTTLVVIGTWEEFSAACIVDCTFPNVKSFKLTFNPGDEDIPCASLLSTLPLSVPNIHSLLIDVEVFCNQSDPTTISDFQKLRDLPLKSLELRGLGDTLSAEDIVELMKTWPELETLCIELRSGAFDAVPILANIPYHGVHLESLQLPLKFGSWRDFSSSHPLRPSHSLRELTISRGSRVPETMKDKLGLARILVSLFPRLEIKGTSGVADDLAQTVDAYRELSSAPPWSLEMLNV